MIAIRELNLWSESGIRQGDAAFIPALGHTATRLTDSSGIAIPAIHYPFGVLALMPSATADHFTDWKLEVDGDSGGQNFDGWTTATRTGGTQDTVYQYAGEAFWARFTTTVSGTSIGVQNQSCTVPGSSTLDLIYFGNSDTHIAYLINSNGVLIKSFTFNMTATPTAEMKFSGFLTGAPTVVKAGAQSYRIVDDCFTTLSVPAGATVKLVSRDGTKIWANSGGTLYSTDNNGVSWTTLANLGAIEHVYETRAGNLLVSTGGAVYRSSNGGASFTHVLTTSPGVITYEMAAFAEAPDGPIFAIQYNYNMNYDETCYMYRSDDDGATWSQIGNVAQVDPSAIHFEGILYNPILDRIEVWWGESWDGCVNIAGHMPKNATSVSQITQVSGTPSSSMGGYFKGAVLPGGSVVLGSDYSYGSVSSIDVKSSLITATTKMLGRYSGYQIATAHSSGPVLLVHCGTPVPRVISGTHNGNAVILYEQAAVDTAGYYGPISGPENSGSQIFIGNELYTGFTFEEIANMPLADQFVWTGVAGNLSFDSSFDGSTARVVGIDGQVFFEGSIVGEVSVVESELVFSLADGFVWESINGSVGSFDELVGESAKFTDELRFLLSDKFVWPLASGEAILLNTPYGNAVVYQEADRRRFILLDPFNLTRL